MVSRFYGFYSMNMMCKKMVVLFFLIGFMGFSQEFKLKTYKNSNYSINYPSTWFKFKFKGNVCFSHKELIPNKLMPYQSNGIYIEKLSKADKNPLDIAKEFLANKSKYNEVIGSKIIKKEDHYIINLSYSHGYNHELTAYLFNGDKYYYLLVFNSRKEIYNTLANEAFIIIKSFKLKN